MSPRSTRSAFSFCAATLLAASALGHAQPGHTLDVDWETSGQDGRVPAVNASCVPAAAGRTAPGPNRSPAVRWSAGPAATRSYALALVDLDVPADLSTVNRAGAPIADDAPRIMFPHWLLANIPPTLTRVAEGADGDGAQHGGLSPGWTPHGQRGVNGFASVMKDGPYAGYMGPCPPWNDRVAHRYRLTVFALDVARLPLGPSFTWTDLQAAMQGHVVAQGSAELRYSVAGDDAR
ncbi:YbhB/YbcL family Raf kinase inhibitor-like protein [Burkholderia ubonensis]|uniref:YbhB/YbcL family Raf kinase inhibitor-like protein n=1 Tax=Burkholderia ubonensis TaxID=101571 RepID=A0AB74D7E2_9BURK|nr:YbhB/YbcL family Raf kinase inhibitor-like protein [Burkholderia ubonensis]PAJ80774.1 hypothetical protein CJO71_10945 [Burkholderia ubonensis]PAK01188.1 hypothetical protein CJO68_10030 [Burkholderia ubonensis]RQP28351.1 YbhB/YbcL family Raf kinase inhibitor-like protein [Burkholderia ubonensis]RQP36156.1 YbhB/YbcL family Raf kinase inhibitor-like protein [Burkholderia ubonensis]RQP38977.1 YbhB/YbcL family Raf kinase inhibitor-like protein [Burkholderia ubonensis]